MRIEILENKNYNLNIKIDEKIINIRTRRIAEDKVILVIKYLNEFFEEYNNFKKYNLLKNSCDLIGVKITGKIIEKVYKEEFIKVYEEITVELLNFHYDNCMSYLKNRLTYNKILREIFNNEEVSYSAMEKAFSLNFTEELQKKFKSKSMEFYIEKISETLISNGKLTNEYNVMGISNCIESCYKYLYEESIVYFRNIAKKLTEARVTITYSRFLEEIFGEKFEVLNIKTSFSFIEILKEITKEEFDIQYEKFPLENNRQLKIEKDIWVLFKKHGPNLKRVCIDFTKIKSKTLRTEVKYFMKNRLHNTDNIDDVTITIITPALNFLTDTFTEIKFLADINDTHTTILFNYLQKDYITQFKKNASITTIKKMIKLLGLIVDFRIKQIENCAIPTPTQNVFKKYIFYDIDSYGKNTEEISEEVFKQLDKEIHNLSERYQVIYWILKRTGLRLKEILFLEDNCINESKYKDLYYIKYIPFKILAQRNKKKLPKYNQVPIDGEMAFIIQKYIDSNKDIRIESNSSYIFTNKMNGKFYLTKSTGFLTAINNLIEKTNIREYDNENFRLTTRQFRKTIAMQLVEEGASTEEIALWLGHLDKNTTIAFYEEVRKKKLSEMNTEFFKKKFDVLMDKNLEAFDETERKVLYIDFIMGQRKVELGYCSRPFSEGICERRNREHNCFNCNKLCTGKSFLTHWEELFSNSQNNLIKLEKYYKDNEINDYNDFKEYQQEKFFNEGYRNIINVIKEKG